MATALIEREKLDLRSVRSSVERRLNSEAQQLHAALLLGRILLLHRIVVALSDADIDLAGFLHLSNSVLPREADF
jgi:hypothetical protein